MEISEAMRTLKSEVKDEIRSSLKNLNQFLPELPADLEAILERNENLEGGLESLKENFPFPVSERPSPFEEKLNFSQVHIMVRVHLAILGLARRTVWFPAPPDKLKTDLGVRSGGRERLAGY